MLTSEGTVRHTAIVTISDEDLVEQVLGTVREARSAGLPVSVNLSAGRAEALRRALGEAGGGVTFTDTDAWIPHPVRRLRAFEAMLDRQRRSGAPACFVGECATAGLPELALEWARFDALLDELLSASNLSMTCVYDRRQWRDSDLEKALAAHPRLGVAPAVANEGYLPPARFLAATARAELLLPAGALRLDGCLTPAQARAFVLHAARSRLPAERLDELSVVVSELVTNARRAGAARVEVACFEDDDGFAVQIDDDGPGIEDVFAGYRPPSLDAAGGRGLWIARQLADLLEIARRADGTSVRVRMCLRRAGLHRRAR